MVLQSFTELVGVLKFKTPTSSVESSAKPWMRVAIVVSPQTLHPE